ncbi:MAG: type II toxin-antitoxin system RelE/ParE family toxin [Deltaproteobacteria bacterium]|nr:type II toxin-antitoxin system RelE/ParE family toxin [Deltaproteobacteria bacterium]
MGARRRKIIDVQFYKSNAGSIPVKEWLKKLTAADRKNIGDDIRTVEFGWPIGMPLVGKIDTDLWEVRSNLCLTENLVFSVKKLEIRSTKY